MLKKIFEIIQGVYPKGDPFVIQDWNTYVKNPSLFIPIKNNMVSDPLKFKNKGAIYAQGKDKAQENYQFVFISILEDNTVLVVGKTSFWSNRLINGTRDSREDSNFGDLIKPYNIYQDKESAKKVISHYNDNSIDIDDKVTTVIIIPIDVSDCSTEEYKHKHKHYRADTRAEEVETMIGDALLNNGINILNKDSHRS